MVSRKILSTLPIVLFDQARAEWWEKFEKMQVILREASSKQLDAKTSHKYYWAGKCLFGPNERNIIIGR